ncbi:MAG: Fic family protein [Cytophagales bacterium]|nr:Fic family protein [Cytophagales bacterium]
MKSNIKKCIELKQELDQYRPLKPEDEARIMQKFRLDWNFHSNHLEGNTLTYGETKALILFGITAQGKPLKDHFEITGHNDAIKLVSDIVQEERPLTEAFIRELHVLILKESYRNPAQTLDGTPTTRQINIGEYKTTPNHVLTKTGETFYFASPEETPAKMTELIDWYREEIEKTDANTLLIAAQFHYNFICIHPFDDGNGRIARLLMNFILMQGGYAPVVVKTEDKENYFAALRQADAGIIEAFIDYIAINLIHSLDLMVKGAKGESIEEEDDITKEIKLLKQKLNSISQPFNTIKSKESILNFFNKNILPIAKTFIQKSQEINNLYIDYEFSINYFIENPEYYPDILEYNDPFIQSGKSPILSQEANKTFKAITNDTVLISLNYTHKVFRQTGFGEFDFESIIDFEFHKSEIHIKVNNKDITSKFYDDIILNEEINQFISNAIKEHIKFIDDKIEKKQNGDDLPF